jgi:glycosyltransferase involved in cell wall biosynthesis
MPDYQPVESVELIRSKAIVCPPGIEKIDKRGESRAEGPVRILWAARWEHDKNPEEFFKALEIIKSRGVEFRVSVVGEQFREGPEVFVWGKKYFSEYIERWGYQPSRDEYEAALGEADLIVSTARHEFFGISVVEGISTGAYPVLPKRLAYPEILGLGEVEGVEEFFYEGGEEGLANRLMELAGRVQKNSLWGRDRQRAARLVERFEWDNRAKVLDEQIEKVLLGSVQG